MNRLLVLILDRTPLGTGTTFGDIRKLVSQYTDDDVDLMRVWRVYDVDTLNPSTDATVEFAMDWSARLKPTEQIPAFVRHHCPERKIEFAA